MDSDSDNNDSIEMIDNVNVISYFIRSLMYQLFDATNYLEDTSPSYYPGNNCPGKHRTNHLKILLLAFLTDLLRHVKTILCYPHIPDISEEEYTNEAYHLFNELYSEYYDRYYTSESDDSYCEYSE